MTSQLKVDRISPATGANIIIDGVTFSIPDAGLEITKDKILHNGIPVTLAIEPTAEQMADKESAISKLEALGFTRAEINTLI